jgi:rhodanese-related sulfurtransferase
MQITYYATNIVGLSAGLVGALLLASKVFDGFTDLMIGFIINKLTIVKEKILPDGIIADLRSPGEFAVNHLNQSINVPMGCLSSWLTTQQRDTPVVFLCRTGVLSDTALIMARTWGFKRVYSLGGILSWAHQM